MTALHRNKKKTRNIIRSFELMLLLHTVSVNAIGLTAFEELGSTTNLQGYFANTPDYSAY